VASAEDDPARKAEMADSLSLAFLVLLESCRRSRTPASSPHGPAATWSSGAPRFEASREQQEELATRFFAAAAAEEGDLQGLEELLAHDVVLRAGSGGKAPALARAVHGRIRGRAR
jgi:hypothetical protein